MQRQLFLSSSWRQFAILMLMRASLRPAKAFVHIFEYRQLISSVVFSSIAPLPLETDTVRPHDPVLHVQKYTQEAIRCRGQPRGLTALEKLGELCSIRASYDFNQDVERKDQSVLISQKRLLPSSVTKAFHTQLQVMEQNGWLSTNPDSVDGLPSLHLNLVSAGESVAGQGPLDNFQQGLQNLLAIVEPYVYGQLLPNVQEAMQDPSIAVSEVFLRRYGQDIGREGNTRNGISAHYDVFSKVTAVIALDDTAADGTNGLYTTAMSQVQGDHGSITSNHASLRRYFPLKRGDGVVHTWDILHGVDIVPDLDRTSLIVWFTPLDDLNSSETISPPWLIHHPNLETDNVAQFVLASAIEVTDPDVTESPTLPSRDSAMHNDARNSLVTSSFSLHPHDLYLTSAAAGNSFALTRLASLSEDRALSQERAKQAIAVLEKLGPLVDTLPVVDEDILSNDASFSVDSLANQLWLHGAVRGNALAQTALADNMMEKAVHTGNKDLRLVAAVLFGLAAQQGHESATESLARVVNFQMAQRSIQEQEEFESLQVIQTAKAALCAVPYKE
jgi:hypothetical protein